MVVVVLVLAAGCGFNLTVHDGGDFWAFNYSTNKDYSIRADKMAENNYCTIWVERGNALGAMYAQEVANEYAAMYEKMINVFGDYYEDDNGNSFNTMQWADFYGDNDGKLCILLLDIKDSYHLNPLSGYVAGYFWSRDFYDMNNSNNRDMIYIDTNPGFTTPEHRQTAYSTLAHEMQHLMNFITSRLIRSNSLMDTWIDEGLSSAAEWLYAGKHIDSRIDWYNDDPTGWISYGNNFYLWDNYSNQDPDPILDEYSTVYLFFQWLRIHTTNYDQDYGPEDVWYWIAHSPYPDYRAVTEEAAICLENDDYLVWGNLLRDWLAANYINNSSGPYGYKNELTLKAHYFSYNDETTCKLYPGEGVYSYVNTLQQVPPSGTGDNGNIKYAGLATDSVMTSGSYIHESNALLTYNINTFLKGGLEEGIITGASPPASIHPAAGVSGRSVLSSNPIAVSGADMLRRNGFDSLAYMSPFTLSSQRTGADFLPPVRKPVRTRRGTK